MHAPVSGKASSAESARPRAPADRQIRLSWECSEMTVMSAPVAHAVGACRTHNIVAMRTARPKQIMAGIDPLTAEIPRQEETDDDRREYRPIQDLERPFPVCTAFSDMPGDRHPGVPQHACCTTRCSCRRAYTGAHLRREIAVAEKGRWEAEVQREHSQSGRHYTCCRKLRRSLKVMQCHGR